VRVAVVLAPPPKAGSRRAILMSIRPSEVDAWLADSLNKRVTYHRTTSEAAQDIVEHGVDIDKSRIGSFGQGFYTATASDPFYGDVEVPVAIRLRQPLAGEFEEVDQFLEQLTRRIGRGRTRLTSDVAAAIRRELLGLGYDGIVVRDAGGDDVDYVIALDAATVKVIRP
jgi:hypothetical protein